MPIVCVPAKLPVSTRRLIKHKHRDGAGTFGLQARMMSPCGIGGFCTLGWKIRAMAVVTRFAEAEVKDLHGYFGGGLAARPLARVTLPHPCIEAASCTGSACKRAALPEVTNAAGFGVAPTHSARVRQTAGRAARALGTPPRRCRACAGATFELLLQIRGLLVIPAAVARPDSMIALPPASTSPDSSTCSSLSRSLAVAAWARRPTGLCIPTVPVSRDVRLAHAVTSSTSGRNLAGWETAETT